MDNNKIVQQYKEYGWVAEKLLHAYLEGNKEELSKLQEQYGDYLKERQDSYDIVNRLRSDYNYYKNLYKKERSDIKSCFFGLILTAIGIGGTVNGLKTYIDTFDFIVNLSGLILFIIGIFIMGSVLYDSFKNEAVFRKKFKEEEKKMKDMGLID